MSVEVQAVFRSMRVSHREKEPVKILGERVGLVRTGFEGLEERMGCKCNLSLN